MSRSSRSTSSFPRSIDSQSPLASPAFRTLLVVQGGFGMAYSTFLMLPKVLATKAGADDDRIGLVMASFGLANVLGAPVLSRTMGALGPRRAMIAGNLIMAAAALGCGFLEEPGVLAFVCRALQGLAWALMFSAGGALVVALSPAAALARGLAVYSSASLVTNAVAPALAEPAIVAFGSGPVFAAAALPALAAALLARRLPDLCASNPSPALPTDAPSTGTPWGLLFVSVVVGIACGVMFSFHQPLALSRGASQVSSFLVAYTGAALFVRLALGRFTDRLGPRAVAHGSFLFYGAVVAAMATLQPGALALMGALYGLAHGTFFPAFMTICLQAVPPGSRDRMIGWVNATFNGGSMAVAVLGAVGARAGWTAVFVPTGLLVTAAAAMALRRPAERATARASTAA